MNILDSLNNKQKEAVTHTEGPLLILAGAGSGKTTVLVNRIAYLIYEKNVRPYNILSITFTNKAAREMKERVMNIIGDDMADDLWMGTFHSVCARLLRINIDYTDYDKNFVIYDTTDTTALIKECMRELNIDEKNYPTKLIRSQISRAKDAMLTPEQFETIHASDFRMKTIAKAYVLYQKKLKSNNALDFDDILYLTVKMFKENPSLLEKYQERFKYILVDEYQDTNDVQYKLISMLAAKHRNLCVVGDDDQSIYGFRGANINNILDFEREFNDAVVIKLEQNYRSTQNILNAANSVIANNMGRKGKELWTDKSEGNLITHYTAANEYAEGEYIAKTINKLVEKGSNYNDCAILYRTNVQSRVIEEMMLRNAVPYRILAGLRFYDRKEIKDIMAYLKVLYNPHDDISLTRIINEPKRGIGDTTIEKAKRLADASETSLFAVLSIADQIPELSRAAPKIKLFMDIMRNIMMSAMTQSLTELVKQVMMDTGYISMLQKDNTNENKNRLDNLEEFMTVVQDHENSTENADLGTFIESVSLISDIDSYDEEQDAVVLMTVHSAKGLEFPNVFLAGMEEGLFPGVHSADSEHELEEERRLCYVAITRAKEQLYITNARTRNIYGRTNYGKPSRFVREIPDEYIDLKVPVVPKFLADNGIGYTESPKKNNFFASMQYATQSTPKSTSSDLDFKKGDVVIHKKFGRGIVMDALPVGNDFKLVVNFDSAGPKNLMAAFAKLEKVQ